MLYRFFTGKAEEGDQRRLFSAGNRLTTCGGSSRNALRDLAGWYHDAKGCARAAFGFDLDAPAECADKLAAGVETKPDAVLLGRRKRMEKFGALKFFAHARPRIRNADRNEAFF